MVDGRSSKGGYLVVLSEPEEKKWNSALTAAQSILSGATAPRTAPDYEASRRIRQEQRRLNAAETEALCQDYRNNMSSYELAVKWGVNRKTVIAILDRNGIKQRVHSAKLSDAELTEAQALRAEGWSVKALARKYGISPTTMKKRLTPQNAPTK